MRHMRRSRGFTLLEVMMATAILAVGTVSVLMVFGTAISFAHRRQGQQQLTQVLEEARSDARSLVNTFRPGGPRSGPGSASGSSRGGSQGASASATPAGEKPETDVRPSRVFAAYAYQIRFEPVRRDVPDAGWKTTVTVKWGEDKTYTETLVLAPDVIADEEFTTSVSWDDEQAGRTGGGVRETR